RRVLFRSSSRSGRPFFRQFTPPPSYLKLLFAYGNFCRFSSVRRQVSSSRQQATPHPRSLSQQEICPNRLLELHLQGHSNLVGGRLAYRLRALLVRGFESAGEAVSPQLTSLVESKPLRPVSHPGGKECIHEVRELDEEGRAG